MARARDLAVRALLLDRAAAMLRSREPVTLRSLTAGTPVSTMAVYTYFGSMDGLWSALRQEGFSRLSVRLAEVHGSPDPVRDLVALSAAYVAHAMGHPDLYRVMFEADVELVDAQAADDTLEHLVQAVRRGRAGGRFAEDVDPLELAVQTWAVTHGLVSLVATGPLSPAALGHVPPMLTALFHGAGDDPARCRASVRRGWTMPPDQ